MKPTNNESIDNSSNMTPVPRSMQNESGDLSTQSALLDISQEEPEVHLKQSNNGAGSPLIDKLPREIRYEIYSYLLVNPVLGTSWSVIENEAHTLGKREHYDLHPAILQTCRMIYMEASEVLYGTNTFFITCFSVQELYRIEYLCPITRHLEDEKPTTTERLTIYAPSIKTVRRWRVLICEVDIQDDLYGTLPPDVLDHPDLYKQSQWQLLHFCQSICRSPPRSLEVIFGPISAKRWAARTTQIFHKVTDPLHLLLKIPTCCVRLASSEELRNSMAGMYFLYWNEDEWADTENSDNNIDEFRVESFDEKCRDLRALITGQSPVELVFAMFSNLLSYAQAFERDPTFKDQMGLDPEKDEEIKDIFGMEYENRLPRPLLDKNPYRLRHSMVPLEEALSRAKWASNSSDWPEFKLQRAKVLEILEQHCVKIAGARHDLALFLRQEKMENGIFGVNHEERASEFHHTRIEDCHEVALTYLEDYASAFDRDINRAGRAMLKSCQDLFDTEYNRMPRETLLRELNQWIKLRKFENFRRRFKRAVDDVDKQFTEILLARSKIFEWDISEDRGFLLGLEIGQCDKISESDFKILPTRQSITLRVGPRRR